MRNDAGCLADVLENENSSGIKRFCALRLGRDVAGHPIAANLESMPHLLIAGTTGSGKSVMCELDPFVFSAE